MTYQPLAAKMRPRHITEFFGQSHLLAAGKPLRRAIEQGQLHSMILWGPPGTGKTTLAALLAENAQARIEKISAVLAGVKEIRQAVERAQLAREREGQATVLFIDEVHRFNKAQQDAFLPHIEDGTLILIGATTENPSFELNNALLSRAKVYVLKQLQVAEIVQIIQRAMGELEQQCTPKKLIFAEPLQQQLAQVADGDARRALNLLEIAFDLASETEQEKIIDETVLAEVAAGSLRRFDKKGEQFYDQISALHKSVRGSAPDAALYWLARMLDGGCDPAYILRRVVRMASEDIGNADPRALELALNAWDTFERLGAPEGELALAQAVVYLACAPKSNAVYLAFKAAMLDVVRSGSHEVPLHLRNAPTKLMQQLDYGKDYRYAHDEADAYAAGEHYFPEQLGEKIYYQPVQRGLEIKIAEKLAYLRKRDQERSGSK